MTIAAEILAPVSASGGILRQYEFVEKVRAYNPAVNEALLNKAYVFSMKAHGEQLRHSGDPYYAHPIEVAGILTNLRMDTASICTALLHDVLEDTPTSFDELSDMFGEEIASLVEGVTKLSQIELSGEVSKQAENFQKFVLAMSKDLRVLLVKLCDRLHNMRTLQYHPKAASRERIARETMEIYAPLARRIGVDNICSELEDLSFFYLNNSAYESITKRLDEWRENRASVISQTSVSLRDLMDEHGITCRLYGREKRPFAIWRKLERQGISFEDVADIYAFRIITETPDECYRALGAVHQMFRCVPSRFRDFISVPKSNGYQSLQTTIMGPDNRRVEVQIRTERMDDVAERGVAAHWAYKSGAYTFDPESAKKSGGDPLVRIRSLLEMMEHGGDADEFLENAKLDLFTDQVFTFTPQGDLIPLPRGTTPIDFAYAVHTDVGDTCVGALINQQEKPLRTRLQNGDVVKIIRGGTAEPQVGWENLVVTGRARSALRRLTRDTESEEFRRVGQMLADHAFSREDKDFSDSVILDAIKRLPNMETPDDVYEALGRGTLSVQDFMLAVFPGRSSAALVDKYASRDIIDDNTAKLYISGRGLREGMAIHLAECCSPINGDRIVGIMKPGHGVEVHVIDCEVLASLETDDWLDLGWQKAAETTASNGRVEATIEHVPGALAEVTALIGEASGNLTNIKTVKRSPTFFDMILDIEVLDTRHLSHIVAALRASSYVVAAKRARAEQV